jgi:hypothetical protein
MRARRSGSTRACGKRPGAGTTFDVPLDANLKPKDEITMPFQDNGPENPGPWGGKQQDHPPEIDALLREGRERLKGILPPGPAHLEAAGPIVTRSDADASR